MGNDLSFVLRVLDGEGATRARFLGTGLLIAPARVLTCRHVVLERDPTGRPTDVPVSDLRVETGAGRQVRAKAPIMDPAWDLALLELEEPLSAAPPPLLWGIVRALEAKLRRAPLLVVGYAQVEHRGPLWQHLMAELFRVASYREGSETLTQLQLGGGIPAGCSGGPALLPLGGRWAYAGTLYLGGERAAASRLIMADPVAEFLAKAGLQGLPRIDATRALAVPPTATRALELLVERPEHPLELPNPYRGLQAFREIDAPYFHGRETETQALYRAVREHPLVTLVGASGSGKSSLLFAGLVPRLRAEGDWQIASFRPKGDPFGELASALAPLLYPDRDKLERRKRRNRLARDLAAGALSLSDVLAVLREERPEGRLLLVADQLEELYTQNLPRDRQRQLLAGLAELVRSQDATPHCTLLLSLRADFLGRLLGDLPLGELFKRHPKEFLGPMDEARLRAAIAGPAAQLGVALESGLAERILKDLGEEPGNLPLLEFALTELWERQERGTLTHGAYEAMGGVNQALARHADAVLARYPDREPLRRTFVQLVRPGEGTEDTRQIATKEQVGEANWPLVKELADARLVVTGREEDTEQETVEVVHEALIRHWRPLREWIDQDRQFRTWQNRLRQALKDWEDSGRDVGALLRGARLAEAEERLAAHRESLAGVERDYVETSITEREHEGRVRRRRTRLTVAGLAVGLLITIGLSLWVNQERERAEEQRELALTAEVSAQTQAQFAEQQQRIAEKRQVAAEQQRTLAFARQLAAQASLELTSPPTDPVKGTLLAVESLLHAHTLEGYAAWSAAMHLLPRGVIRLAHRDPVQELSFNPDGSRLATAVDYGSTAAGKAQLWDAVTGQALSTIEHAGYVVDAKFSPDGKLLAIGSWDHTVVIADAETGEELRRLTHDDAVSALAFSPNGSRLAIAEKDGAISLIDPVSGALVVRMKHSSGVVRLAFSADGLRLAAASEDRTVIVWNTETGEDLVSLVHEGSFPGLAFSSAGPRLVSWNDDKQTAEFVDVATGQLLASANIHFRSFTRDDTRLVAASGKDVVVWDTGSGEEIAAWDLDADVWSVTLSDNGTLAAIALWDNQVAVFDLRLGLEQCRLPHDDRVRGAAFSPDGTRLATVSDDKVTRIWDATSGQELLRVPSDETPSRILFSPDGRRLLTTKRLSDGRYAWGEVAIWNTEDWRRVGRFAAAPVGLDEIAFDETGETINTVRSDGSVRLVNVHTGAEELSKLAFESGSWSLRFTKDGARILDGGWFEPLEIWDVREGRLVATLAHPGGVDSVWFDRSRLRIATSDLIHGPFRIWDAPSGKELGRFDGGCCLSASGQRYLRSSGGQIEIRDTQSDEVVSRITPEGGAISYRLSPSGTRLAVLTIQRGVELWDVMSEKLVARLDHPYLRPDGRTPFPDEPKQVPIWSYEFSPDGGLLATQEVSGRIHVWEALSGQRVQTLEPNARSSLTSWIFSGDSRHIALVNIGEGVVSVWDARTGGKTWGTTLGADIRAGWPLFSPDGSRLAFGRLLPDLGGVAQVWDIAGNRLLFEFPASPTYAPTSLEFTPDGSYLAVATADPGAGVGVWDLRTGKERVRLEPDAGIKQVAFAADGSRLFTEDLARTARAWDLNTGEELFRFDHLGGSEGVAVDSKANRVATWNEALVRVWDTASARAIATFRHNDRLRTLSLSPDGTRLATVTKDASQVDVFEVGSEVQTDQASAAQVFRIDHGDLVRKTGFSPDGSLIVTLGGHMARIWDAASGAETASFEHDDDVERAILNADNSLLSALLKKNEVHLWHVPTGRKLSVLPVRVVDMSFSPSGDRLAITAGDANVRIVAPEPARPETSRMDLGKGIFDTAISPDGRLIATHRYEAKEAKIREVATGAILGRIAHDDNIWGIEFTPDGAKLASRSKDGTTRFWDARSGSELLRISPPDGNTSLRLNPDGRLILMARPTSSKWEIDHLEMRDTTSGEVVGELIEGYINARDFSPNGRHLATGEGNYLPYKGDGSRNRFGFFGARIWDAETGREVLRLPHDNYVYRIAFSPDGKLLATETYDTGDPMRLWNTKTGALVFEVPHPKKGRTTRQFAFSPDSRVFAVRTDEEVSVWSLPDHRVVSRLRGGRTDDFSFSPDGRFIVVEADEDGWVWDWVQERALLRIEDVTKMQFTPDSARLIAVHEDNSVRVWGLRTEDLVADACSRLERNLTRQEWRTYLGEEPYRRTCPELPVPEN